MKKIYLYIIVITIGIIFLPKSVFAYNENTNETEAVDLNSILDEEKENFGIKDFIKAAESYSPDFIKDLNISNVFDMALSGKVDNKNILSKSPFETLDQSGVGELITIAVNKSKCVNSNIKLGICGEHGGDKDSIEFFNKLGLNYVSCSPYRIPVAALSAAKSVLKEE